MNITLSKFCCQLLTITDASLYKLFRGDARNHSLTLLIKEVVLSGVEVRCIQTIAVWQGRPPFVCGEREKECWSPALPVATVNP